jgi:hypothetical protein
MMKGGTLGDQPFDRETKTWGPAPAAPVKNALDITATNVSQVTIDGKRAKVSCHPKLNITSDGPITVTVADCH